MSDRDCPLMAVLGADESCPMFATFRVLDRERLERLLHLAATTPGIETVALTDPCRGDERPVLIDISHLTEKQWRALEVAAEFGYYDASKGGHLADIAEHLGISKSGASQRLRAAEAKIISAILGTGSITCSETDEERPPQSP